MQRSFSSSSANYQHYNRLAVPTSRYIPIRLTKSDHYSSDTDSYHQANLQRTSSTSSFCSSSSASSAKYRILPVRYSSVDRIIQKPATITANEHGINVRIRFERPNHHHHHHHNRREHKEENEHHRKRHMIKEQQHYKSSPVLNNQRPSNIKYIETRSIVRGYSIDQLNRNTHSNTLIIRQQSLPPLSRIAHTQIKHIPLDTHTMFKPIMTRVIREEEE
jgi:hypothetical protein